MEAVDFVTYFKAGSTFVVQKGNPNKVDSSNLCGVKVAVQTGTTQEEEVNKANEQCKADGKDAIDIQSSKLQTDVTTAVASGKADIFYADTPVAGYAIKQTGDTLEALGEDVGVTPEAVAVKKGDSKTAEAVQKAIQKLLRIYRMWTVIKGDGYFLIFRFTITITFKFWTFRILWCIINKSYETNIQITWTFIN